MEILVIAAHPDDEVLGLGGTICKLASQGHAIHLLIVTDGSTSQYKGNKKLSKIIEEKKRETLECSKILGIKTIDFGMLPDMRLDTVQHVDINSVIGKVIEKYKIDTVFTHFYGDVNKDHYLVYESSLVATRPFPGQTVKKVLLYKTPSSTEWNAQNCNNVFLANVFVDTSEFETKKIQALSCYSQELRQYPHPRSTKAIECIDRSCGIAVGTEYAESFMLIRQIL